MTEETLAHIRAQLFNDKLIGLGDATAVPTGSARATLHTCTAPCGVPCMAWLGVAYAVCLFAGSGRSARDDMYCVAKLSKAVCVVPQA